MTILIAGLILFFGSHLFATFRPRSEGKDLKVKLGYGPYMGLFSLVSAIGLGLIIWGYDAARPATILYQAPVWGQHINLLLMLVALIALAAAYTPAGHIKRVLKHPMLVAIKLWAFGHLLANGELNSVLLFGSFLAYAVLDRIIVKRREVVSVPNPNPGGDMVAVAIGLVAYGLILVYLHPILFGVAVLPGV